MVATELMFVECINEWMEWSEMSSTDNKNCKRWQEGTLTNDWDGWESFMEVLGLQEDIEGRIRHKNKVHGTFNKDFHG